MFSVEFCFFLSVGGYFIFEGDNNNHGFTLETRANLLKEGIPIRYETRTEWQRRQDQSIERIEKLTNVCKAKKELLNRIKNRVYVNKVTLARGLLKHEMRVYCREDAFPWVD